VLHISIPDLAPEVVVEAMNVVDDIEHCLRGHVDDVFDHVRAA
jgi:hypothetical protein